MTLCNASFNHVEFDIIKNKKGLNIEVYRS